MIFLHYLKLNLLGNKSITCKPEHLHTFLSENGYKYESRMTLWPAAFSINFYFSSRIIFPQFGLIIKTAPI